MDLSGTTFWEFKDGNNAGRMRRIARYPRSIQLSEVKISPAWHQWLRHTRQDPPSIEEQEANVQRQIQLKQLAQLADERWASKASYLDSPKDTAQTGPLTAPRDSGGYSKGQEPKPYQSAGGPSEKWQPEAWNPSAGKAKRSG
jgi:NADH dehydrogenase [ubiquinone] 1 alpha subcomplex assembly factor 2